MLKKLLSPLTELFKKRHLLDRKLEIYTDGSHKGRWGAWAFVVVKNNKIIFENSGRIRKTNSHRMEFQAAIEALSYLKTGSQAFLYTDSRVLIQSALQKHSRPSVNSDQVELLNQLSSTRQISWKWVKAHSGIQFNERCDQLCISAREQI